MNVARSTSRIWLWRACSLDWGWQLDLGAFSRFSCRSWSLPRSSASGCSRCSTGLSTRCGHNDANWPRYAVRHICGCPAFYNGSPDIGFHHIHHLNPRIPNYRLEDCHGTIGGMEAAPILTLRTAISTLRYALWDENLRRMVRFP